MSFDVNVGRTQPMITAAENMANNGGSGGNLGYMSQNKKKKNANSIFDGRNARFGNLSPADMLNDSLYAKNMSKIRKSFWFKLYLLFRRLKKFFLMKS